MVKKIFLLLIIMVTLFGCADDFEMPKKTEPVEVEITRTFATKDISNWYFQESSDIMRCAYWGGGSTSYNSAMTLYAKNLLNNNISEDTPDAYIQICDGESFKRVGYDYIWYDLLWIKIVDIKNNKSYSTYFKQENIEGYENQLISQTINQFKSDPTASYIGNFYVEVDETY